jgi:mannose-1-phosphate guanylyltransferase
MDFAVIMAGGSGKRLWPLSRQTRPKQVIRLLDGQTLLRNCFERLLNLFDLRNILVVTNAGYADLVRENLSELPQENIIAEPCVRDTAGAIGLAAAILTKFDPDATMAVVTADQMLEPEEPFVNVMKIALEFVKEHPQSLVTFGIDPTFPSTQYGYIKMGAACSGGAVYRVEAFREKPDEKTAREYLRSGKYCWNSGMFVWKAGTILDELARLAPQTVEPLRKIRLAWGSPEQESAINEWFPKLPKISIDFAVMEKSESVYGLRLPCRWLDLGSFAALADVISSDPNENVVVAGQSELLDSRRNIVITEDAGHLIALIGVENLIVAHTPDATLVCPIDEAHRLKELLEKIETSGRKQFL